MASAPPSQEHIPFIYSQRVRRAIQLAEQRHRGAQRKAGDHPYFLHLVAVAQLLTAAGADDDLLCAAFLHDVVEDTMVTSTEIGDEFGGRVADLVAAVTKPAADASGERLSPDEKDELALAGMRQASQDAAALKAADLIANVSDLIFDQRQLGYQHWSDIFGERADRKLGHYLELARALTERLDGSRYAVLARILRERSEQLGALHDAWAH